ncbi:hypothetical protein ACX1DX_11735 [Tessaracoccus sp. Y36]|uniref:hypothetical protein n=1 Tax=Tessaracoccus sp. MC1756 TaxID=2760311 RepID=UPI001601BA77|nr:hypothetical protein [Tessaracoccus sp. MC1756]MBB1510696.1 hypothetical protein [Tessaracoccus sp. MC1756]
MDPDDVTFQQAAQDNERLRKALAADLEVVRAEMTTLVAELESARDDARVMAERLVERDIAHDALRDQLAAAEASQKESAEVIAAQKRHIERLKKQLQRPIRVLAKKALGRGNG